MELALTIIAGFGVLLFLFGYLSFVLAGFKHHFITGVISALPVLNIVTIPALWHKTSKKLMLSFLGVLIAGASWFLGGSTGITKTISLLKGDSVMTTTTPSSPAKKPMPFNVSPNEKPGFPQAGSSAEFQAPSVNQLTASKPYANKQRFVDPSKLQGLPGKPLYRMSFEEVPVNKINVLNGRIVKITTRNNEQLEGRIIKVSESSVVLQTSNTGSLGNELPIVNIKQLRLMVKKAN